MMFGTIFKLDVAIIGTHHSLNDVGDEVRVGEDDSYDAEAEKLGVDRYESKKFLSFNQRIDPLQLKSL